MNLLNSAQDDARSFAGSLYSEIESIHLDDSNREAIKKIKQEFALATSTDRVDFARLLTIEKQLLRYSAEFVLRRNAWLVRERFGVIVGEDGLKKYHLSNPPDPMTSARDLLEADMECLLDQIHKTYLFNNARECMVSKLKRRLAYTAAVVIISGTAGAIFYPAHTWLAWLIIVAGMLGALTSIYRRLQVVATTDGLKRDSVVQLSSLSYGQAGIYIALFSGMVFALLLYCLFASGLLGSAGVFPVFTTVGPPGAAGVDLDYFIHSVGPKEFTDYAKLMVWSYAVGFGERYVPDVLDRLVHRS